MSLGSRLSNFWHVIFLCMFGQFKVVDAWWYTNWVDTIEFTFCMEFFPATLETVVGRCGAHFFKVIATKLWWNQLLGRNTQTYLGCSVRICQDMLGYGVKQVNGTHCSASVLNKWVPEESAFDIDPGERENRHGKKRSHSKWSVWNWESYRFWRSLDQRRAQIGLASPIWLWLDAWKNTASLLLWGGVLLESAWPWMLKSRTQPCDHSLWGYDLGPRT